MFLTPDERILDHQARGWWTGENVDALLNRAAAARGDAEALIDPVNRLQLDGRAPERLTWSEIDSRVDGLAAALLGMAYPFANSNIAVAIIGFVLVTVVYVFVAIGWASYVPELFPTEIRLRATGYCNAVGRIAAALMPFAVVPLFNMHGIFSVSMLLVGILVVQAIFVAVLGVDTNRKPLEALVPAGDGLLAGALKTDMVEAGTREDEA